MEAENVIGLVIAVALSVYLGFSLFFPERF